MADAIFLVHINNLESEPKKVKCANLSKTADPCSRYRHTPSLSSVLSCIDHVSSDHPSDSSKLIKRSQYSFSTSSSNMSLRSPFSDSTSFLDTPGEAVGYVVGVRLGSDAKVAR